MAKNKSFSEIEWQILRYVWQAKRASVKQVWHHTYPEKEKAYTTVQTYMDRMVEKAMLSKEKIGLVNFYSPLISEKQALEQATAHLVGRAFKGSYGLLAQFLVDSSDLSSEDFEKIKALIKKKEEG